MKGRLIGIISVSLLVLAVLLVGVVVWEQQQGPDTQSARFATREAEQFLNSPPVLKDYGDVLKIIKVEGPLDNWVLLTLARFDPALGEKTGTSGLLAIGRFTDAWEFRIQGQDETFDLWIDKLPDGLLETGLREYFRYFAQESSYQHNDGSGSISSLQVGLVYYLPYPNGQHYTISTIPGQFHHRGSIHYAIDFDIPEGSAIASVVTGEVIGIKDDSNTGGCNKRFADKANFIRVKTGPAESVLYLHTQTNSIAASGINIGDEVKTGQILAKAGSTGFTCNWQGTGPGSHLHIVREKWCGNRICGSLPLKFVEFGPSDPRNRVLYASQNLSTEQRKNIEEESQRRTTTQIKQAVGDFLTYYSCAKTISCDELVQPEADSVTQKVNDQLLDEALGCLFCITRWDEHKLNSLEYLPSPAPEQDKAQITAKQSWETVLGDAVYNHFSVVKIFLVNAGGVWKADGWQIECGFVLDSEGEIVHSENLEGCPWQPENGSK